MQPIEQIGSRFGVGVSDRGQQNPDQRNANAVRDHGDHQNVDAGLAELPVRGIHRQRPRFTAYAQQIGERLRRHGAVQPDMLEKPIEPPSN